MRIGIGYDVHCLAEGRRLVLGGVEIPYEKGLLGHSDADVLLHSVMDAMLGACALGDIGVHFPDSDETYRNCSSLQLLCQVGVMVRDAGYELMNLDSVVIAERPKLRPYIAEMHESMARALSVEVGKVSVKATTTERLGFTGRGEGIAAQAIVLLRSLR